MLLLANVSVGEKGEEMTGHISKNATDATNLQC